jgi:hypothetical protein
MSETEALVILGIVCVIAAIAGGGLKAAGFNIPPLESRTRQLMLGAVGSVMVITGIALSERRPVPLPPTPTPGPVRSQPPPTRSVATPVPQTERPRTSDAASSMRVLDLFGWRHASENICAGAAAAAAQTSDPISYADVYLDAATQLRSVGLPSDRTAEAEDWHAWADEVTRLWYQVARARVNGDLNADVAFSEQSADAARRANSLAATLGLGSACYFSENP